MMQNGGEDRDSGSYGGQFRLRLSSAKVGQGPRGIAEHGHLLSLYMSTVKNRRQPTQNTTSHCISLCREPLSLKVIKKKGEKESGREPEREKARKRDDL